MSSIYKNNSSIEYNGLGSLENMKIPCIKMDDNGCYAMFYLSYWRCQGRFSGIQERCQKLTTTRFLAQVSTVIIYYIIIWMFK